jgi:hypothetical protein
MKVYSYSEARQKLAQLLDEAQNEEVLIRRKDGTVFSLKSKRTKKSPFDVKGINGDVSTKNILDAVRESRER